MSKTSKQIQGDIYSLVKASSLINSISGSVYRNGMRPRDSQLEDIIVTFTTGTPDQIQEGVVTVNIYVPDITPYANGVNIEDGARLETLEKLASIWVDSLTTRVSGFYKIKLSQTIYTEEDAEIKQHFVVIKLHYYYYDNTES